MLRSHTCGELRIAHSGAEVTLCGWVDTYCDHGGTLFIDLRDRYGKTQVVFGPDSGAEVVALARRLRGEDVIQITGAVAPRPEGTINPKLDTGEIEVRATVLNVLNKAKTPPFTPSQQELPGEDLRLKYRYLDLRRGRMQNALYLRSRIIKIMRDYFAELDFIDVETPILGAALPKVPATTSFPAASSRALSMPCLSHLNCTNRS